MAAETTGRMATGARPTRPEGLVDLEAALLQAGQAVLGLPGEGSAGAAGWAAVGIAATSSAKAGQGDTTTGMRNAHATRHAPLSRILSVGYAPGDVLRW